MAAAESSVHGLDLIQAALDYNIARRMFEVELAQEQRISVRCAIAVQFLARCVSSDLVPALVGRESGEIAIATVTGGCR